MNQRDNYSVIYIVILITVSLLVLLIAFYLIGGDTTGFMMREFIGILVAAVVSGFITLMLLKGQAETQKEMLEQQQDAEEKRSKGVRIYSNKIAAFSAFNREAWREDLDDMDKSAENVGIIRKQLFSKVLLYLSAEEIDTIREMVDRLKNSRNAFPLLLSSITDILNANAGKSLNERAVPGQGNENYRSSCQALWNSFNDWISNLSVSDTAPAGSDEIMQGEIQKRVLKPSIQPWHFCMLWSLQLDFLDDGGNELSLVEYGEGWRTNLVRQVKVGDIVFLFRGSKRYSGVFRARGWRIFEYDNERNVVEHTSEGIAKEVVPGEKASIDSVAEQLKKFDIYQSYLNPDSTFCANVVVERISYLREGVENPNSTYRKTISRYYPGYAINLLENFVKADPASKKKIDDLFQ